MCCQVVLILKELEEWAFCDSCKLLEISELRRGKIAKVELFEVRCFGSRGKFHFVLRLGENWALVDHRFI